MGRPRILIVEDERITSKDLARRLTALGYEVAGQPTGGEEAIELALETRPDIILMDIQLSGAVDGIEAARRIRALHPVPVVYLTAYADDETLGRAKPTAPYGYLLKPCSDRDLRSSLEIALYRAESERKLREADGRLARAHRLARIGEWDFEPDSGLMNWSHGLYEVLGVDPQIAEASLGAFLVAVREEDRDRVRRAVTEPRDPDSPRWFEFEMTSPDGATRTLQAVAETTTDNGVHIVGAVQDITEQKRAEVALKEARDDLERRVRARTEELARTNEELSQEVDERRRAEDALRESEERFRMLFESARDSVFIKDRERVYTLVNPAMAETLGLPADKIIGKRDEDIFDADDAERLAAVDARVLEGRRIEHELTISVNGIPTSFHDIRAPMHNVDGRIVGVCGIARNITERRGPRHAPRQTGREYPSAAMRSATASARLAGGTDSVILLTGESGSGKDHLARYIHDHSKRAGGPFFSINCAALPHELAESELFGHEAGAFTGAVRKKRGLLELAEGGTLLLNEVGELSLELQAKLLAFLDSKSFTRLGAESSISVDNRIIAATNRDLKTAATEGRFRSDLYYRLNVFSIRVPPLRDRLEDLPILVRDLIGLIAADLQLDDPPDASDEILAALAAYDWPGNVRELRNVLERALILAGCGPLEVAHLGLTDPYRGWSHTISFPESRTLHDVTGEVKRSLVEEALLRSGGNKRAAALLLGISHDSLYRYLERYGAARGD